MSIKVMAQVWEHSPAKGAELLLLLALADSADDNGIACLTVPELAERTRMTPRRARRVLLRLADSGAIEFTTGQAGLIVKMAGVR